MEGGAGQGEPKFGGGTGSENAMKRAGRTVTLLASTSGVLALFAVADTIKDSSKAAITELKDLGVTPVMW